MQTQRFRSNYTGAAIEYALRELGVTYHASPKEALMPCIFHVENAYGKHLSVNILDKPGIYKCWTCKATGTFEVLIAAGTQWSPVTVARFMRKCSRAVASDDYTPPEKPKREAASDEDRLAPYLFRHSYPSSRGIIEETLLRFSIGYDRAANAIVFPWFDRNGKLLGIKRRSVLSKFYSAEADTDTTSTVFGLHLARSHGYFWLTEGEFDAMYLDQSFRIGHYDDHCALALGGTVLHEASIVQILKREPQAIILLLDNDDAGVEAANRIVKQLARRVQVYQPTYPASVKDPNELNFEQVVQIVRALNLKGTNNAQGLQGSANISR